MKIPISKNVMYVFLIAKTNISIFSDIYVIPNWLVVFSGV